MTTCTSKQVLNVEIQFYGKLSIKAHSLTAGTPWTPFRHLGTFITGITNLPWVLTASMPGKMS